MNANNVQLTYEIILLVHNPPKKETYQRSNPFHQAISNKSEFIDHRISGIYVFSGILYLAHINREKIYPSQKSHRRS